MSLSVSISGLGGGGESKGWGRWRDLPVLDIPSSVIGCTIFENAP